MNSEADHVHVDRPVRFTCVTCNQAAVRLAQCCGPDPDICEPCEALIDEIEAEAWALEKEENIDA